MNVLVEQGASLFGNEEGRAAARAEQSRFSSWDAMVRAATCRTWSAGPSARRRRGRRPDAPRPSPRIYACPSPLSARTRYDRSIGAARPLAAEPPLPSATHRSPRRCRHRAWRASSKSPEPTKYARTRQLSHRRSYQVSPHREQPAGNAICAAPPPICSRRPQSSPPRSGLPSPVHRRRQRCPVITSTRR